MGLAGVAAAEREEQQVASCCSPVFGITAVLLGLDYSADSGVWNVCSTERAPRKLEDP